MTALVDGPMDTGRRLFSAAASIIDSQHVAGQHSDATPAVPLSAVAARHTAHLDIRSLDSGTCYCFCYTT